MGHADPHGYYRVLNVAPRARAVAIEKAYRRRLKELDPAHNRQLGTAERHAALKEAHEVLSDPRSRALYDTEDLTRAAPGAPAAGDPVPCGRCRRVSAQPRYVIFHQPIGRLVRVFHDHTQGIYCPRCARDVGLGASLWTWALGWWAVPNGPVAAVRAIGRNMRGGEMPAEPNARLLTHQAEAFAARGKPELARALAAQAVRMDPDGPRAKDMQALAARGEGDPPVLQDPWRGLSWAAPMHLLPGLAVAAWLFVAGPLSVLGGGGDAPDPFAGRAPGAGILAPGQAAGARILLRAGPGPEYPVVARVGRFDGASVIGAGKDGWLPIQVRGLTGFVRPVDLEGRAGTEGVRAWCLDHREDRPESGRVVARRSEGHHAVDAANQTPRDLVLKLRDGRGRTVVVVYLRAGDRVRLPDLPEGPFTAVYATGDDWSGPCRAFLTDPATFAPKGGIETAAVGEVPDPAPPPVLVLAGPAGGDLRVERLVFAAD